MPQQIQRSSIKQQKKSQKKGQKQNIFRDKMLENLNNQSSLSHNKTKQQPVSKLQQSQVISQRQNKQSPHQQISQNRNSTSLKSRNIFQNQQFQVNNPFTQKQSYNQFLSEQQIQNRLFLNGYFQQALKQVQDKKVSSIAQKHSNKIQDEVKKNISNGKLGIQKHKQQIKNLLNQFRMKDEELIKFEKKVYNELRQEKNKMLDPYYLFKTQKLRKSTNKSLQSQPSQRSSIVNEFISHSVLTKQQHKKLIRKFIQSRKQAQQKIKYHSIKQQQKQKSLSLQKIQLEEAKLKQQKQLRRLSIEQNLLKKKKQHEQFIIHEKVSSERYKLMKKQKFLYQNMEDKYKSQIIIPELQERKIKLRQIRDLHKKFDLAELKRHQQQYLQKKSLQNSKSRNKNHTFHYNPPQRAKRIQRILQQQKLQSKIKFQQKKRIMQQNKLRQINFISDIKIKFKPKIDTKKREQIELRLKSQESDAGRTQLPQKDLKLLGMKHFQDAKKNIKKTQKHKTQGADLKIKTQASDLNKKISQSNQYSSNKVLNKIHIKTDSSKRTNASFSSHSKPAEIPSRKPRHKKRHVDLDQCRRKQIRKLVNSTQIQRQEKLQKLKLQNQRINQIYKRREKFFTEHQDNQKTRDEAINLLLNSIQTKMGIIDVSSRPN